MTKLKTDISALSFAPFVVSETECDQLSHEIPTDLAEEPFLKFCKKW
jgi:hypothetical protein